MLSVKKCRGVLNMPELTDDQVEEIRDSLYQLAEVSVTDYLKTNESDQSERLSQEQPSASEPNLGGEENEETKR